MQTSEPMAWQEMIPLECDIAESKKDKKTLLIIKNDELYQLVLEQLNQQSSLDLHYLANMAYFEYHNKKYFTDKLGSLIQKSLENGQKQFGIAFIDKENHILAQWYHYNIP